MRKDLYLVKHPETKHGGGPGKAGGGKVAKAANFASFVKDAASKTGMSESAIETSIHRATSITPEVKATIADMPNIAGKGVELDALASLPKEDQARAVEMVKSVWAVKIRS